jgi:hypothetical protein
MARSGAVKPTGSSGHSYRDDSASQKSSVPAKIIGASQSLPAPPILRQFGS